MWKKSCVDVRCNRSGSKMRLRVKPQLICAAILIAIYLAAKPTIAIAYLVPAGCPPKATRAFHYGPKATAQFALGDKAVSFSEGLRGRDVGRLRWQGPLRFENPLGTRSDYLDSASRDVEISVITAPGDLTKVTVSTQSLSCTKPKDWRPYWREFLSYMHSRGVRRVK